MPTLDLGNVIGKDATINGKNVLNIVAGDNVTIEQSDDTLTISVPGIENLANQLSELRKELPTPISQEDLDGILKGDSNDG